MRTERVGFALCGSFCTHAAALEALKRLCAEYETVIPIVSETAASTDTRFGTAKHLLAALSDLTGQPVIQTIRDAEPIGPKKLLDVLVIAPATGNTLAKLASGVTDSAVTMAAKAHLRNGRPVVVAVSSNDALSGGARNIAALLSRRDYYFVPFGQDDPVKKPASLVADFTKLNDAVSAALRGEQVQPVLV